ncbi:hypothetical protein C8F04DRAFT_1271532 [Mycena alexandri]|uniref:Uncharacterized protein n=1 Tax=Mycena alexandri TaxID=1745969 RepID=A0AAD6S8S6_9AGAR|nr:hypothetical protein C8F04DRAFT_1271532 [Mycena alexandri]
MAGVSTPPKARQAFQQFMHESYESEIAPVVRARWKAAEQTGGELTGKKGPDAPFRARVARELFAELPEEEQDALRARAKAEALSAREVYTAAMKQGPSKSPEDRQRCIDALGPFVSSFLRGVSDYTGLHSFAVFGGPIPEFGGTENIAVTHGYNRSAVPCTFPQWAKTRFSRRDVLEFMKDYLRTAFTPAECEEAALPQPDGDDTLARAKHDTLAGAKYTLAADPDLGSDDESDSDDASGSDSSTMAPTPTPISRAG